MLDSTNLIDRSVSYAHIIARMETGNSDAYMTAGFEEEGRSIDRFVIIRNSPRAPVAMALVSGDRLYIIMRGIETFSHGAFFVVGGLAPGMLLPTPFLNTYVDELSNVIMGFLPSLVAGGTFDYYLVGHSLGGAVIEAIAVKNFDPGDFSLVEVVTLGSPKPGNYAFAQSPQLASMTRWINLGDSIPCLLPKIPDAPYAQTLVGPIAAFWGHSNVQPPGGLLLDAGGVIVDSTGEHPFGAIYEKDLANWIYSSQGAMADPHHIQTYSAALEDHMVAPKAIASLKQTAELILPVEQRSTIQIVMDLMEAEDDLNLVFERGDRVSVILPPFYLPKIVRYKGEHALMWQGLIVSVHKTRATAKIARTHLVSALRRLQLSQEWSIPNLSTALSQYLQVAAIPTNGFRPIPANI